MFIFKQCMYFDNKFINLQFLLYNKICKKENTDFILNHILRVQ